MVTVPIGRNGVSFYYVWDWEISIRVRVWFGTRTRFRVRLGSVLGLVLGLIILGTLSRYYCAHSITPWLPFGIVTTGTAKKL